MATFDERESAFENKFVYDAETQFKIEARRNKKVAQWAAELLDVPSDEYTRALIKADMEEAGAEDVIGKLVSDLDGKADEATIREKFSAFEVEARKEITSD